MSNIVKISGSHGGEYEDDRLLGFCAVHSLVENYRLIALMMEAVSTSETSANFYETIRCNIPEGRHLQRVDKFLFKLNLDSRCTLVV
jgi:hypothetical protein